MPYLIDTDWMIDRLAELPEAVTLFDGLLADGIAISIITYLELYEGVLRTDDPEPNERKLSAALDGIPVLFLSRAVARRCAGVRVALRRSGRRVNNRALDLVIAATAIEHGLTLVTRNFDDYADIDGLDLHRMP
jgi:tRNA(fMet)-specific endonuclease VapC